jgi:hypothetical protein
MPKEPYHNYATDECTHIICKRLINGTFSVWLLGRRCGVSELGLALLLAMGKFGSYLEPLFVVSVERSWRSPIFYIMTLPLPLSVLIVH